MNLDTMPLEVFKSLIDAASARGLFEFERRLVRLSVEYSKDMGVFERQISRKKLSLKMSVWPSVKTRVQKELERARAERLKSEMARWKCWRRLQLVRLQMKALGLIEIA